MLVKFFFWTNHDMKSLICGVIQIVNCLQHFTEPSTTRRTRYFGTWGLELESHTPLVSCLRVIRKNVWFVGEEQVPETWFTLIYMSKWLQCHNSIELIGVAILDLRGAKGTDPGAVHGTYKECHHRRSSTCNRHEGCRPCLRGCTLVAKALQKKQRRWIELRVDSLSVLWDPLPFCFSCFLDSATAAFRLSAFVEFPALWSLVLASAPPCKCTHSGHSWQHAFCFRTSNPSWVHAPWCLHIPGNIPIKVHRLDLLKMFPG